MSITNNSFNTVEEGVTKMVNGKFAMVMDKIALEYQAVGNCDFLLLKDTLTQVLWVESGVMT